jgi:hypothetical protein
MKQELQNELMTIYERDGALNPEAVIEEARNKNSALHDRFTWDNNAAAHQHRLEEARKLIRVAVTVIPAFSNEAVKQFVSIRALRGSDEGSYISTVDLLSDERKYEMAKHDALKALERLKYQYSYIKELDPIWVLVDAELSKIRASESKAA